MIRHLASLAAMLLVVTAARAQSTAFVSFDGARLYAEADYLSAIVDTLSIGDTLLVLERDKRFVRVQAAGHEGWILAANITDRAPRVPKKPAADAAAPAERTSEDDAARRSTRSSGAGTTTDTPAAQCAGVTKSGRQCSRKAGEGSAYCWQHRR